MENVENLMVGVAADLVLIVDKASMEVFPFYEIGEKPFVVRENVPEPVELTFLVSVDADLVA